MNDQELLTKIENGERLTTRELKYLVFEGSQLDEIGGEHNRWTRDMTTVIDLCGKSIAIDWQAGLTESQENEFWDQPYFVHKEEKTVIVTNWVKNDPEYDHENEEQQEQETTAQEYLPSDVVHSQITLDFISLLENEMNQDQEQER